MLEDATVGETVAMIHCLHRNPMPVAEALRRAGIEDLAPRRCTKLSGGQKQRVRFATALVANPDLLEFVVKDAPPEQLVDAVRRVHSGLRVVDPALAAESLASGSSPLTDREREVLQTTHVGGTVSDVAKMLHLSEGTVRNHFSSAIGKTGARTRAEAARIAEERGWL